jgi:phosphatidylglycerophosphate synthase
MSAADWLSAARFLLVALMWPAALGGQGRMLGLGLIVAAVTDVLDGYLARRLSVVSRRGARLDAIADTFLLVSAAVWLEMLHPRLGPDNGVLLAIACVLYVASLAAGWVAFRRFVDPHQLSAKIAGGLLYAFALLTLLTGVYEPLLLTVALSALAASCIEAIVAASKTIQLNGIASSTRSHSPQPVNEVGSSARATSKMATSTIAAAGMPGTDSRLTVRDTGS